MPCKHCKHCHPPKFERGSTVRLKQPRRGMTRGVGWIRSRVRPGSKTVYVVWESAWAGYIRLDDLMLVETT
jgi:hypothetical protein